MKKSTWIRMILWGTLPVFFILITLFLARNIILEQALTSKIKDVSQKIAMPITFQSAQLRGIYGVTLKGIKVGTEPWINIERIELNLNKASLWKLKPKVEQIYVITPHVNAVGSTLKRTLVKQKEKIDWIRKRLSTRTQLKTETHNKAQDLWRKQLKKIEGIFNKVPYLQVLNGSIQGRPHILSINKFQLQLQNGKLNARWFGTMPKTGACKAYGSAKSFTIYCSESMRLPVNESIEIAGKQMKWDAGESPFIRLEGIHAKLSGQYKDLPFTDLGIDLTLGLLADRDQTYPLEVGLTFPGGGVISAKGNISKKQARLTTSISNLPVDALSQNARGTFSANVQIWADLYQRELKISGRVEGHHLKIAHKALAETSIGPFNFSTHGLMRLEWLDGQYNRFKFSLSDGEVRLGSIYTHLSLKVNTQGDQPHITGEFNIPKMLAQDFADSIPMGLLPHLQPVQLKGKLSFAGNLDLDFGRLDDTILKFKPNLRRVKVLSHNDTINFNALRNEFTTHFEMPGGEVYMRQAGPKTERWIKLSQVSSLLPKAIMAQEDGGFYKHSGISLFHLRGSLIRNLKEGRFVRGGSTLSMQLTRNLFLNRRKTLSRKLEELCLTWLLERRMSKDEMMALYINIVEFGPNLFGIKEASEHYFQKHPSALRVEEIAALTRMLPGPRLYAKFFERKKFSKAYTNRVNRLMALLVKKGHLEVEEYQKITQTSLWELDQADFDVDEVNGLDQMLEHEIDAVDP